MKLNFNRKYTLIAVYAVLVIVISAAVILGMVHLEKVKQFLGGLMNLLSPFVWGFTLAYLINPVLRFMEKLLGKISWRKEEKHLSRKFCRVVGMMLAYLVTGVAVFLFFRIVIPQLISSISSLGTLSVAWANTLGPKLYAMAEEYGLLSLVAGIDAATFERMLNTASEMLRSFSETITSAIPQLVQWTASLATGLLNIVLGLIISIYLLFSKEKFFAHIKKFLYAFFPQKGVERAVEITHESNRIFSGFVSGKILDSLIIGLLCYICMFLFGWPYATLISVIVGVTNVIPYFGPFIGAIPSILILLIVDPKTAILFAVFILALQQLDGNVIGPKILGDSTGLSSFWVIFSITVFSGLLGPVGMFIGVPLFAVIYSLVRQLSAWRLSQKGLSTNTNDYASPEHPIL